MLRAYIILTAYLALTIRAHSQAPWRIESLGVTEGLSQGYIYVIHQDKKGFIWIGTHGGLNRYDGYEFRIFQYTPFNFSTLGDNGVFFLKEDPVNSKFWIGGSSCLNEFDPETFVNTRYRYSDKQLEFADGVFINDHELLLACEYDVLLFNTRDKKFTEIPVYDNDSRPIEISRVENASIDRNGNAMIMCKTGIYFYDPSTRTCKRKTPGSPDFSAFDQTGIFNVLHDSRGFYWIATNKMGLVRYNPVNDQLKKLALSPPLKQEAVRFEVIVEDSRGDIWVGSSHGLFLVNPNTLTYEYFSKQISSPEINAIYEDRNHAIWVGTVGSGISKLERHNVGFKNVMLSKEEADLKTGSYIMGLQQDGDDIWFVNIWDQVGKVDLVTGQVNIQHMPAGYNWYSEGSIVKERNGDLVVLNGAQLLRIQKQKGILQNGLPTPGLTHIFHTGNGKTWYMVKAPVIKTFSRQDTIYGN
ncbi:MAG TPA: two-component regulator propeller domain-containing protein, partial [Chitinophagaceae bacterium]|nr:two-component regulator propeller domain-containing protein [Chitinophagaceae bacterium]